jgi:hypothetical protein
MAASWSFKEPGQEISHREAAGVISPAHNVDLVQLALGTLGVTMAVGDVTASRRNDTSVRPG